MKILTEYQIASFHNDGILIGVDLLTPEETAAAHAAYRELEALYGGVLQPTHTAQLHLYFPWAYRLGTHARVLDLAEDLLGPDVLLHGSTLFCKYPGDKRFIPWHQDGYYMKLSPARFVTVWIAITPSTSENGPMRLVPGTHNRVCAHTEHRSPENILASGLTLDEPVDLSGARDVILRPGQASAHHVNIVHGSGPNYSDVIRVGYALRYVAADVRQELPHHAVVEARGRDRIRHFEHMSGPPPEGTTSECAERQRVGHAEYVRRRSEGSVNSEREAGA